VKKAYTYLVIAFSIFWVGFIFFDYLQKHPKYDIRFTNFEFWNLYILVLGHAILGGLAYHFFKSKIAGLVRGGLLIIPGLILVCITFDVALNKGTAVPAKMSEIFFVLGNYLRVALQIFFIILAAFSLGSWVIDKSKISIKPASKTSVSIATGLMLIVMAAFFIGVVKGLYWFTLGPLLIGCIALNHKNTLAFLRRISLQKLKPSKELSFIGAASFLLLLFLIQINLLQNISPFPKGWDSLSLYVKLPTIINDYHGLVRGYQPYNWSLLMSFGMILFNSMETVLGLSYVGGILCLAGLYAIGKDILKMNQNYIFLTLACFYLIPSVGFQSFQEQKVDLGLLFIVLSIVILLFHWIKDRQKNIKSDENAYTSLSIKSLANPYILFMGLLTGFAFGIKLTTLFTYFSVICVIWFIEFGYLGFLGSSMLCLFAILLVKLDDMSGMRDYHLTANYVQWILLLIGLGTFGYLFVKAKKGFIRSILFSAMYSIFFILMATPWITKNFIDSDMQISFRYILNGKTNEPAANLNYLKKKYDQHLNKQKKEGDGN
jgi:hypothetical protein